MSPFRGIATPEELAIMSAAFDTHCLQHGIVDEHARSNVADLVMSLFGRGAKTVEELTAELRRRRSV